MNSMTVKMNDVLRFFSTYATRHSVRSGEDVRKRWYRTESIRRQTDPPTKTETQRPDTKRALKRLCRNRYARATPSDRCGPGA